MRSVIEVLRERVWYNFSAYGASECTRSTSYSIFQRRRDIGGLEDVEIQREWNRKGKLKGRRSSLWDVERTLKELLNGLWLWF